MMPISESAFKKAAEELNCEVAAVKAAAQVESGGRGFLPDGRPVILYEAHQFSKFTNHGYDKTHPKISSRTWNRSLYATGRTWVERGIKEHQRLELAASLNRDAALQACSWGMFQVMGFNWKDLGYKSIQAFVNAMYRNEDEHLDSFIRFVKFKKLDRHLRNKNWDAFAAGYNGKGYKQNRYDEKLEEAYKQFKG